MIVTAIKIPVPLPIAPMRSATTDKRPRMAPPNAAAVGMTRFSSLYIEPSRCPAITLKKGMFECEIESVKKDDNIPSVDP